LSQEVCVKTAVINRKNKPLACGVAVEAKAKAVKPKAKASAKRPAAKSGARSSR
jgi:hypothetical protein